MGQSASVGPVGSLFRAMLKGPSRALLGANVDRELINFYLDVVQELVDRAVPATVDNINKHLAPANKEHEVIEALDTLVAEGRLVKTAAAPGAIDEEHYQIPKR